MVNFRPGIGAQACIVLFLWAAPAGAADPPVCENKTLLQAIQIIASACEKDICDFEKLKELDSVVDRQQFLGALSNPHLRSVHVFFPADEYQLENAFDWESIKRDQVATLKFIDQPERAVIFVIGSASLTGQPGRPGDEYNRRLSYSRMEATLRYLRDELKVSCPNFRVGWLGREVLQLRESDAHFLRIAPRDYREEELVLNQAVHMFVFPCGEKLP